jgi:DNA-binding PadR family transcriptional regulator
MARTRRPSPQTVAVMRALSGGADWSYGYDICRSLGLKAGTVYPILMRLAERGQVEAVWEPDAPTGRPARHLYRLSPEGAALLETAEKGMAAQMKRRTVEATP